MPRTKEQFQEMREKSKKQIMDSALKLFSSNGFHTTSINKIAADAGVAIGLVYNYFESKEDLLDQIIKESLRDISELMETHMREAGENHDLCSLIDIIFETLKLKIDSWRLILSIALQPAVADIGQRNLAGFSNLSYQVAKAHFQSKGDEKAETKARVIEELLHATSLCFIFSGDEEALELIKNEIIKKYIE